MKWVQAKSLSVSAFMIEFPSDCSRADKYM